MKNEYLYFFSLISLMDFTSFITYFHFHFPVSYYYQFLLLSLIFVLLEFIFFKFVIKSSLRIPSLIFLFILNAFLFHFLFRYIFVDHWRSFFFTLYSGWYWWKQFLIGVITIAFLKLLVLRYIQRFSWEWIAYSLLISVVVFLWYGFYLWSLPIDLVVRG